MLAFGEQVVEVHMFLRWDVPTDAVRKKVEGVQAGVPFQIQYCGFIASIEFNRIELEWHKLRHLETLHDYCIVITPTSCYLTLFESSHIWGPSQSHTAGSPGRPHNTSADFTEPVVWLLGFAAPHALREWLQHEGLVVEAGCCGLPQDIMYGNAEDEIQTVEEQGGSTVEEQEEGWSKKYESQETSGSCLFLSLIAWDGLRWSK